MNERPLLRIEEVSKRFGATTAVDKLSLDVYQGEFFALVGPPGCGKTALMRLIAGFERPEAGRIAIDGVDLADVPPYRRPVNTVFQNLALFPHLTVEANVAFGLKQEHLAGAEIAHRVAEMLAMVKLEGLSRRKPHQLSGAQRQRVALARALVKRPRVLLLDAPLKALDNKSRDEMRAELVELQRRLGLSFVLATDDPSEAMPVADRIGVMERGWLRQVATPTEIYERPNSRWVADFIGDINIFEGRVGDDSWSVEGTPAGKLRVARQIDAKPGATVWVAVRPQRLQLTHDKPAQEQLENCAAATVDDIGYFGDLIVYTLRLADGSMVKAAVSNSGAAADPIDWNEWVWVSFPPRAAIVLTL